MGSQDTGMEAGVMLVTHNLFYGTIGDPVFGEASLGISDGGKVLVRLNLGAYDTDGAIKELIRRLETCAAMMVNTLRHDPPSGVLLDVEVES